MHVNADCAAAADQPLGMGTTTTRLARSVTLEVASGQHT